MSPAELGTLGVIASAAVMLAGAGMQYFIGTRTLHNSDSDRLMKQTMEDREYWRNRALAAEGEIRRLQQFIEDFSGSAGGT